MANRV